MNRSEMMAAVKSKDTQPEMLVRRLVHGMGYRYRLHVRNLPGKPDLVFPSLKKIIFVHGCFWHQHTKCAAGHAPKSNKNYWEPKLKKNKLRDRKHLKALRAQGWECLVLWECELEKAKKLHKRLGTFLKRQNAS